MLYHKRIARFNDSHIKLNLLHDMLMVSAFTPTSRKPCVFLVIPLFWFQLELFVKYLQPVKVSLKIPSYSGCLYFYMSVLQ